MGAVVVGDAGRGVDRRRLDDHAAGHRPGGDQLAVDGDPAVGRRGAEAPQPPAGGGLEGIDPAVGRADVDAALPHGGRKVDGPAGVGLPAQLARRRPSAGTTPLSSPTKTRPPAVTGAVGAAAPGGGRSSAASPARAWRPAVVDGRAIVAAVGRASRPGAARAAATAAASAVAASSRGVVGGRVEIEIAGRRQADVAVERQLAAAHPGPPVEQPVGNDHAVLAGRAHGRDVPGRRSRPDRCRTVPPVAR